MTVPVRRIRAEVLRSQSTREGTWPACHGNTAHRGWQRVAKCLAGGESKTGKWPRETKTACHPSLSLFASLPPALIPLSSLVFSSSLFPASPTPAVAPGISLLPPSPQIASLLPYLFLLHTPPPPLRVSFSCSLTTVPVRLLTS